jgi:hypothetical protein
MLKKFMEKLGEALGTEHDIFDPSELSDPVAMQTDWTPATEKGGPHFRSHELVESNSERLEFRAGMGLKLFWLVFLGLGLIGLISFSWAILSGAAAGCPFWPIVIPLFFTILGTCMLYFSTTPIVFDRQRGFFWKGRKNPDHVFDKRTLKHVAELEKVHALQLIFKVVHGDDSSWDCYELNLVLEDGKRINVVVHGNQGRLREDAGTISAFLDKPVWDAT